VGSGRKGEKEMGGQRGEAWCLFGKGDWELGIRLWGAFLGGLVILDGVGDRGWNFHLPRRNIGPLSSAPFENVGPWRSLVAH